MTAAPEVPCGANLSGAREALYDAIQAHDAGDVARATTLARRAYVLFADGARPRWMTRPPTAAQAGEFLRAARTRLGAGQVRPACVATWAALRGLQEANDGATWRATEADA